MTATSDKKHVLHGEFLDLNTSYSKTELSKAEFYLLFSLLYYIDKLLVMLRTTGIGWHLGSAYSGALSYADDITLLCPSVRGLNEMIVLCCEYAK